MKIEELKEQFDELGVEPTFEVLERCMEICLSQNIDDPVEFVEKWMAYSISKLDGADPTIQYLNEMENSEFINKKASHKPAAANNFNSSFFDNQDDEEAENALLGSYVSLSPSRKLNQVKRIAENSPLTSGKKSRIGNEKSGSVVCSVGNFAVAKSQITQQRRHKITIKFSKEWIDDKEKYMTTSLVNDGQFVTERIFQVGADISRKLKGEKSDEEQIELSHCDELSQDSVRCLGKIYCGGRVPKLDQKSTTFIGYDENKFRSIQLDMSKNSTPIIPGEVCIIEGNNPRGNNFAVKKLHHEKTLKHSSTPNIDEPLSIFIASAPFTTNENFLFEPLEKLIEICMSDKPNLLILTGAFFNANSKLIFEMTAEVDEQFFKLLTSLGEKLSDIQIIVASSFDDINSSACYPTSPYHFKNALPPNVILVPDPCILDIDGIKIGITSVDVTQHIADSEFSLNTGGDKVRRYINYLFHQKTFYPLFPPKIPSDIKLLHEHANIGEVPHIFVAPSDLRYYLRNLENCLCVNAGRLMPQEGSTMKNGTFARLIVQPTEKENSSVNATALMSGQVICL